MTFPVIRAFSGTHFPDHWSFTALAFQCFNSNRVFNISLNSIHLVKKQKKQLYSGDNHFVNLISRKSV